VPREDVLIISLGVPRRMAIPLGMPRRMVWSFSWVCQGRMPILSSMPRKDVDSLGHAQEGCSFP